jgi:hypothetical protein
MPPSGGSLAYWLRHVKSACFVAAALRPRLSACSTHPGNFDSRSPGARLVAQWVHERIAFLSTPSPSQAPGLPRRASPHPAGWLRLVRDRRASPSFTTLHPRSPTFLPVSCTTALERIAFLQCLKTQPGEPQ